MVTTRMKTRINTLATYTKRYDIAWLTHHARRLPLSWTRAADAMARQDRSWGAAAGHDHREPPNLTFSEAVTVTGSPG